MNTLGFWASLAGPLNWKYEGEVLKQRQQGLRKLDKHLTLIILLVFAAPFGWDETWVCDVKTYRDSKEIWFDERNIQ